jgi:hypothetical protein
MNMCGYCFLCLICLYSGHGVHFYNMVCMKEFWSYVFLCRDMLEEQGCEVCLCIKIVYI